MTLNPTLAAEESDQLILINLLFPKKRKEKPKQESGGKEKPAHEKHQSNFLLLQMHARNRLNAPSPLGTRKAWL